MTGMSNHSAETATEAPALSNELTPERLSELNDLSDLHADAQRELKGHINAQAATIQRVRAACAALMAETSEVTEIQPEHWRGLDYAEGKDDATISSVEAVLEALNGETP